MHWVTFKCFVHHLEVIAVLMLYFFVITEQKMINCSLRLTLSTSLLFILKSIVK